MNNFEQIIASILVLRSTLNGAIANYPRNIINQEAQKCDVSTWQMERLADIAGWACWDTTDIEQTIELSAMGKAEFKAIPECDRCFESKNAKTEQTSINFIASSAPLTMSGFTHSSSSFPCPVCARTHDDGCAIANDGKTVLCRSKAHDGSVMQPPDAIAGYRFTGKIDSSGVLDRAVYVAEKQEKARSTAKSDRSFYYPAADGSPVCRTRRIDPGNGEKKWIWQEYWIEDAKLAKFAKDGHWLKVSSEDVKKGKATAAERSLYEKHRKELEQKIRLYQIDEAIVLAESTGLPLMIVEGETTAEALMSIGIPATTAIGGAKKFGLYGAKAGNYTADLDRVAELVIAPDSDKDGIDHADAIAFHYPDAKWLYANPAAFCWVGMPSGGYDCKNWIDEMRGTNEEKRVIVLGAIVESQREFKEVVRVDAIASAPVHAVMTGAVEWEYCPHSVNYNLCRTETRGYGKAKYEVSVPIANFDFVIERVLQSETGGGLVLAVSRVVAGNLATSRVIVDSQKDCGKPADFANGIKRGLGVNVVCNMRMDELQALLAVKTEDYHLKGGQVYKLIDRIGQQEDGTWVFDTIQFTKDGRVTNEEETRWVFNPRLSEDDFIPCPLVHEPNPEAIRKLVLAAHGFYHEITFMHFLFACGWVAAGVNYQEIMKVDKCFPIYNPYGDKGSGKTTAIEAALSMVGWNNDEKRKGILAKSSVSALYERLKNLSSLPQCWDDPTRGGRIAAADFDETLKGLYGAAPRVVRGNTQQPRSPLAVTSNHTMGDSSDAARSRLIQTYLPKFPVNADAYAGLADAMLQASGGFASLISIGYAQEEIADLEKSIRPYLSQADQRISRSIALISYYAGKVASLAGIKVNMQRFVIDVLCPVENDAQTTKDSLEDFLEKLSALQSSGAIGEWNARLVETIDGKFLAIHMPAVWKIVDKEYSPIYSQGVLRRLIDERDGQISSTQKFPLNQQVWQQYERNRMQVSDNQAIAVKKPDMVPRRCVLIPAAIAVEIVSRFEADPVSYISYSDEGDQCNQPKLDAPRISAFSYSSYISYINKEEEEEKNKAKKEAAIDSEKTLVHEGMFPESATNDNYRNGKAKTIDVKAVERLQWQCNQDVTMLTTSPIAIPDPMPIDPAGAPMFFANGEKNPAFDIDKFIQALIDPQGKTIAAEDEFDFDWAEVAYPLIFRARD